MRDSSSETDEIPVAELEQRHAAACAGDGVPGFAHWKVTPRIRAGRNPLTERDVAELAALGITHVLDLREEGEWHGPGRYGEEAIEAMQRHGLVRRHVPMRDFSVPAEPALGEAVGWIEEVLDEPRRRLYVHCRAGLQRSATVLIAWRSWASGEPIELALWSLRRFGWPADPLYSQRLAVVRWLEQRRTALDPAR